MPTTLNPFPSFGKQLTDGLTAISKSLTPKSMADDLVDAVYKYVQPIYYPSPTPIVEIEIKSVIINVINTYRNNTFIASTGYDEMQLVFIQAMLCCIKGIPINSIPDGLRDIENNVGKSGLTIDEQTPLLLTLNYGIAVNEYWIDKTTGKPEKWSQFFNSNPAVNYANIPFWTQAAMQGSLIGYNASPRGLIAPTSDIVSTEIISSLLGALAIGTGKVIFNWLPLINIDFGGGNSGNPAERKTNTGSGSYTEATGLTVKYTADYTKGKTTRFYFD